ncbi:MAG TPA: S41 family peptidase [Steroidobacteraceae bacterium]|nr:S41 family peptidase [Steroidobacteraceae bacterium]
MSRVPNTFRVFMVFACGLVLGLGLSVGPSVKADRDIETDAQRSQPVRWQDARLLAEVLEHVRGEYVESISDEELINAAIRGLMADLDPHSAYLDPSQFEDIRASTTGNYSGLGIEVAADNGMVRVVKPMEGGPAERAGVLAGDRILAVDDMPVDPEKLGETIDRMRGKAGSMVKLTLARSPDAEPLSFSLTRASVRVNSVKSQLLEPHLGYVRIVHFSETTRSDLEHAVADLKEANGNGLAGLVLDLRGNPGGLLEAGVAVADAFLDEGVIVTADGRAADARFEMRAEHGDLIEGAPLTVLVNGDSASASEIVAGALHDHKRALLVGSQTYGKGSVQTVLPLSGGRALKLTTSKYFTPSGASIHKTGITPDIIVDPRDIEAAGNVDSPAIIGDLQADYVLRLALQTLKDEQADMSSLIRHSRAQ